MAIFHQQWILLGLKFKIWPSSISSGRRGLRVMLPTSGLTTIPQPCPMKDKHFKALNKYWYTGRSGHTQRGINRHQYMLRTIHDIPKATEKKTAAYWRYQVGKQWVSFLCLQNVPPLKHSISVGKNGISNQLLGVPVVAQWLTNPTGNREVVGAIPGLAQWVKDSVLLWAVVWVTDVAQIRRCYGSSVGRRLQLRLDP